MVNGWMVVFPSEFDNVTLRVTLGAEADVIEFPREYEHPSTDHAPSSKKTAPEIGGMRFCHKE